MPDITDAELDAATMAYVRTRYPVGYAEWQKRFPDAYAGMRERMRMALIAAAEARGG